MSTPSDLWLIPESALERRGTSSAELAAIFRCRRHLQSAAPLDAFALLGQCWFALVALGASAGGLWTVSPLLVGATALVLGAHLLSVGSMVRMGWRLTGGDDAPTEEALMRDVAKSRLITSRRARVLFRIAGVCLAAGLLTGAPPQPSFSLWVISFVTVFPWFSMIPRWNLEAPLLEAVASPGVTADTRLPESPGA